MSEWPEISVWVTVGHRRHVLECLPSFLSHCTYPNYRLLIAHEGDPATTPFLEGLNHPRKELYLCGDGPAHKYNVLRSHTPSDWYYCIQDDWLYYADPAPAMKDAIVLMRSEPSICMVKMTSHTPFFMDLVAPRFRLLQSIVGPIIYGFGMADVQNVTSMGIFRAVPDLWPDGFDFYGLDGVWQRRLLSLGLNSVKLMRHWGSNIHVGHVGESGKQSEENRLNEREGKLLVKYGMFGERPDRTLYTTALNEEQKQECVYPMFLHGIEPVVAGPVPYEAQARRGTAHCERI